MVGFVLLTDKPSGQQELTVNYFHRDRCGLIKEQMQINGGLEKLCKPNC